MNRELMHVIDQISFERGLDRAEVVQALETALISASRKRLGEDGQLRVRLNQDTGDLEILVMKTVVERPQDVLAEIPLAAARAIDPEAQLGGKVEALTDLADFGRVAAQTAKQVIVQRVREAERDHIHHDFKGREGDILTGTVHHKEKGDLLVDLGKTEGVLPKKEQIPRESYRGGDQIRAFVLEVRRTIRGPQVILSRTAPEFLVRLFALEVPEIRQGLVKILGAARDPGERAKIAVLSTAKDVDAVGACVGVKGSRVQSVVRELRGEKVDIVPYAEDVRAFLVNALAPALVDRVEVDEGRHALLAVVPDDQLSLAIGKKGQNVRLAAKLLGWEVDIKSRTEVDGPAAAEAAEGDAPDGPAGP
ncbi:MAG TPA: transcription termination factor NusA [bacterium]